MLFDPTQSNFFLSEGGKLKNLGFSQPRLNQRWLTRLEQQKIDPTRIKKFSPGPITTVFHAEFGA